MLCCIAIVVYLIGPSSVGKSTAATHLEDVGEATQLDLDAWIQNSGAGSYDWPPIASLFAEAEPMKAPLPLIVDIGAGSQDMERRSGDSGLRCWLNERASRVILIDADPIEICGRNPHHGGKQESFNALEYAPERLALYAVAGTKLVITGMSKEAAVTAVTDAFREVVRTQTTIERSEQDET